MNRPFLTADLPGTGGTIKEAPDDFRVEEIPLYLPCGEGEHLYITIEKRGLTTHQLVRRAAQVFAVEEREIGTAGLKDANATTVQTLSVPRVDPAEAPRLENDRIRILAAVRHRNKLRTGHLAGNRFRVRIARPAPDAARRAEPILAQLQARGMPNYFGEQRYGALGHSQAIGRAILRGEAEEACRLLVGDPELIEHADWRAAAELFRQGTYEEALARLPRHCRYERELLAGLSRGLEPRKALLNLPRPILRLYLSAYQSSLFDRLVAMRMATIDRLWPGDIAWKHANGACFPVTDPGAEQPRADRFEISATAPLYGHKVKLATGQSGILEASLLDKENLSPSDFRLGSGLAMAGERRPLRAPLASVSVRLEGPDLILGFDLPRGSYATSLLREVMKAPASADHARNPASSLPEK